MERKVEKSKSSISEKISSLNLYINLVLGRNNNKVVGITSSERREGKSEISFELSKSFAKGNKKVLLIDGDVNNYDIARICGIKITSVFFDIFHNDKDYTSIINKYNDNLDVLFLGDERNYNLLSTNSDEIEAAFEEIKSMYDYVIIDLETINDNNMSKRFFMHMDGLFLITVSENENNKRSFMRTKRIIDSYGCRLLGFVINKKELN